MEHEITSPENPNPLPEEEGHSEDQLTEENDSVFDVVALEDDTHNFEHFPCMVLRKCRWCWQQIKLLRGAVRCQNCGIIIHHSCQRVVAERCGVPEELWDHYNLLRHDIKPASPSFDIQKIVCWVYQHRGEQRELQYLKFAYKTLYLYGELPGESTNPDQFYPLGAQNVHTKIVTDVSGRFHGTNLDKYISVQFYDTNKSGAPLDTLMLEFQTDWDRETFLDAYDIQTARLS